MSRERIEDCVRDSLEKFLKDLGGESVTNVYAMVMKTVEKPRLGLVIVGSLLFGGVWLISCTDAYVEQKGGLAVPLVGPLTQWSSDPNARGTNAGLIFLTLVQTGGLAMLIAGALTKKKVLVPDLPVTFAPTLLPGGGGLAAVGTF